MFCFLHFKTHFGTKNDRFLKVFRSFMRLLFLLNIICMLQVSLWEKNTFGEVFVAKWTTRQIIVKLRYGAPDLHDKESRSSIRIDDLYHMDRSIYFMALKLSMFVNKHVLEN